MRTPRRGRHRTGRIAEARPAEVRDAVDVDLPQPPAGNVTGEPLAARAMRDLDPEVLRDDLAEGANAQALDEAAPRRSAAYRAGRRTLMLGWWGALGFALVLVASITVPSAIGLRDLTVLSGSMEPTISTGDIVVERQISPLDVRLGDVVSFKDPEDASILITHRVQSMVVHDGVVSFVTKGDANTGVERWQVSADGTIGKVEYHVPRLGVLLFWIRGPLGRIVLIVVPALVLGAYELVRIWRPKPGRDERDDGAEDGADAPIVDDAEESGSDVASA